MRKLKHHDFITTMLRLFRIASLAIMFFHDSAPAIDLPPHVEDAFRKTLRDESGGLASFGNEREIVFGYVKSNWKELLDNLEEIPSEGNSSRSSAMVVGAAAEELDPSEYLDFLDHFLETYSRGKIEADDLRSQLFGANRKSYFVAVNAAHPRVQALLLRAKELVPKENVEIQNFLDRELAGARSDMYLASGVDDSFRPETLPGIRLRTPFESMIDKVQRITKPSGADLEHAGKGSLEEAGTTPGAPTVKSGRRGHVWGFALALAVLALALWRAFAKRSIPKTL